MVVVKVECVYELDFELLPIYVLDATSGVEYFYYSFFISDSNALFRVSFTMCLYLSNGKRIKVPEIYVIHEWYAIEKKRRTALPLQHCWQ